MKFEPAATVLKLLGVRPLARKLKVSPGYVGQWQMERGLNGTGGRIPADYRDAIFEIAQEAGFRQITKKLLSTEPEKTMGKMQRDKGARHEREVTKLLKGFGLDARKVPLSGAAEGYPGDVEIVFPKREKLVIQCKCGKLPTYKIVEDALADADIVGLTAKDCTTYIAMHIEIFTGLLNGEGEGVMPVNFPITLMSGGTIAKAIHQHDVLIFKMDRKPNRVVMLSEMYLELVEEFLYP